MQESIVVTVGAARSPMADQPAPVRFPLGEVCNAANPRVLSYFPRGGPKTPPIERRIRELQEQEWGKSMSLQLQPRRSAIKPLSCNLFEYDGSVAGTLIGCLPLKVVANASTHASRAGLTVFIVVICRHRLEVEKERAAQKRSQEAVHKFVTSVLRKVCSRYGQAYRPRQTDDAAALQLVQPATAAGSQLILPAENQENRESEWAQQPLELKVHLYAPFPAACCFILCAVADMIVTSIQPHQHPTHQPPTHVTEQAPAFPAAELGCFQKPCML